MWRNKSRQIIQSTESFSIGNELNPVDFSHAENTVIISPEVMQDQFEFSQENFQSEIIQKLVEMNGQLLEFLRRTVVFVPEEPVQLPASSPNLPLNSIEELKNLNEWLEKEDNKRNLVQRLCFLGGRDLSQVVSRILCQLLSQKGAKIIGYEMRSLYDTKSVEAAVREAVRRNKGYTEDTNYSINKIIENWLQATQYTFGGPKVLPSRKGLWHRELAELVTNIENDVQNLSNERSNEMKLISSTHPLFQATESISVEDEFKSVDSLHVENTVVIPPKVTQEDQFQFSQENLQSDIIQKLFEIKGNLLEFLRSTADFIPDEPVQLEPSPPNLPLHSIVELEKLNEWLEKEDNKQNLIQRLRILGGSDLRHLVSRILCQLLSRKVAKVISFTGQEYFAALSETKLLDTIYETVRHTLHYITHSIIKGPTKGYTKHTNYEIDRVVEEWLEAAKHMIGGRDARRICLVTPIRRGQCAIGKPHREEAELLHSTHATISVDLINNIENDIQPAIACESNNVKKPIWKLAAYETLEYILDYDLTHIDYGSDSDLS